MANEIYIIRTSTLREIADSIRMVRGLTAEIPTSELASALRTGTVTTTAEPTKLSILRIRRQTLVDIADVVREQTGDTADIPVSGLSAAILSAFEVMPRLNTPSIYLTTEEVPKLNTPSIYLTTEEVPKLATPAIRIEIEKIPKLSAPSIYLETAEETLKLDAPILYQAIVDDDNGATTLIITIGEATYEENSGGGQTLTII